MAKYERSAKGPYIRWLNYGSYEGWKPDSYDTLLEALGDTSTLYSNEYVITKPVKFVINEIETND